MMHKPTEQSKKIVSDLNLAGFSHEKIANYMGITDETLRKHYSEQLTKPLMDATAILVESLYQDAMNGDKDARKFFLTHRGGLYPAKAPDEDKNKGLTDSLLEKIIDKIPSNT